MRLSDRARLVLLVATLATVAVVVLVTRPVGEEGLRDALEPLGLAAPVAYVLASTALGLVFVPGPLLAGAAGLLFGTALGFAVTLAGAVLTGVVALELAKRTGRRGAEQVAPPRVQALAALARRRGVLAVTFQRLIPGVPDAPCSYAFGLAGVRARDMALGTLIGSAPRGFSYTAIGDGIGGGSGTLALVGLAVLVVTGVAGALLAGLVVRRAR